MTRIGAASWVRRALRRGRARRAERGGIPRPRPGGTAVTVFPTCLVDALRPDVADATCDALRGAGFSPVLAAHAGCCGQPAWNAGLTGDARRVARGPLRRLARARGPVVVPSGSCATMVRLHWPELFAGTRDERAALDVAGRTVELTQLLASRAPASAVDAPHDAAARPPAVAYHASCHLTRHLGVVDAPRRVLRDAGWSVVEPDDGGRCCGFGGTFAVKLPEVSAAIADEKLDALRATGAGTVVGCDLSCLAHLEGRARVRGDDLRFVHVSELVTGTDAKARTSADRGDR